MTDTIDKLAAMSDDELNAKLGLSRQLAEFKSALAEAQSLSGDARKKINEDLDRQLEPHIYPSELKYQVERAKEKAAGKTCPEDLCCNGID